MSFVQALVSDNSPLQNLLTLYRQKIGDIEVKMLSSTTMSAQPIIVNVPPGISKDKVNLSEKLSNLEKRMTNSKIMGSDMSVQSRNQIFNTQSNVSNYIQQFLDSPSVSPSLVNETFTLLHVISKGLAEEPMEMTDRHLFSL